MVRVCQDWFPKGSYKGQRDDGFPMNDILAEQIQILAKNIRNDWDFTILISGGGEVRVGKSVLAFQIAVYWHWLMKEMYDLDIPFTIEDNIVLQGDKLIKQGNKLGEKYKYAALVFDEAGADLEGKKVMRTTTQDVLDYYRECGQYNMLNILVIPEFFDLPKGIVLSRSIILLDVYYSANNEGIFQRGLFHFYSRPNKKKLYLFGRKDLNYNAARYDFRGQYENFYPFDKEEYQKLKQKVLKQRGIQKTSRQEYQRSALIWYLYNQHKLKHAEIAELLTRLTGIKISRQRVGELIAQYEFMAANLRNKMEAEEDL